MSAPRTLYDKIWDAHLVHEAEDGTCLLYIDRHLVHEVTSPKAFEGLRMTGRKVRAPGKTVAVPDHNVPTTTDRASGVIANEESRIQVEALQKNAERAVSDLRSAIAVDPTVRFQATNDTDFKLIREEPAFIDVVEPTPAGA